MPGNRSNRRSIDRVEHEAARSVSKSHNNHMSNGLYLVYKARSLDIWGGPSQNTVFFWGSPMITFLHIVYSFNWSVAHMKMERLMRIMLAMLIKDRIKVQ